MGPGDCLYVGLVVLLCNCWLLMALFPVRSICGDFRWVLCWVWWFSLILGGFGYFGGLR